MDIVRYAAVTALVMAPLGAFAADLPEKTAPKTPSMVTASSQAMAFYIEGQLGATQVMDLDTATYSGTVGGVTYTNTKATFEYKPAFAYGVEAGLARIGGSPVRLGLAYQGFTARVNKVTGSGTFAYNGNTYNLSQTVTRADLKLEGLDFDNRVGLYMVNAYYDFDLGNGWRPYVGAGIGLANIQNAKNNELALNGSLGVQYDVTSNVYLGAKVQLSWVNGPKDKLGLTYDNVLATTAMLTVGTRF